MKQLQLVAVASILLACGGAPGVDSRSAPLVGLAQEEGEWGGSAQPIGSFETSEGTVTSPGEMTRVVLMADRTAHVELTTTCARGVLPCAPRALDGYHVTSESDGVRRLSFLSEEGDVLHSCEYHYDGRVLEIAHEDGAQRQALAPSTVAWCAAASQCEQQYLPTPLCTGQWTCVDSRCQFQCGRPGLLQLE